MAKQALKVRLILEWVLIRIRDVNINKINIVTSLA